MATISAAERDANRSSSSGGTGVGNSLNYAHLLILAPLVAQEHVLVLTGVTTPSKYTLEHPKDTTRGERGVT
jgi:hypothetical protein